LSAAQPAAAAQVVPSAGSSAHAAAHSRAVVDSLRGRLKDATSEFRDVLGARQAALAAHAGRRELFSAPPPAAGGGGAGAPTTARPAATSPPPAGSTSPNVLTHRGHGASPAAAPAPPSARPLFGGATAGAAAGRTPLFAGRGAPGAAASAGNSSETCVPTIQQQQQQQQQPLRQRRVPGAFGGDGRCVRVRGHAQRLTFFPTHARICSHSHLLLSLLPTTQPPLLAPTPGVGRPPPGPAAADDAPGPGA